MYVGGDGVQKFPYRDARGGVDRTLLLKARGDIETDPELQPHVRKRLLRRASNIAGFLLFGRKEGGALLEYKSASVAATQYATEPSGIVTAYAAAFDNADEGDDVLHKGATIASVADRMRDPARPQIRVLFSHFHDKIVGHPLEVREDDHGVLTKSQYNMNTFWGNEAFHLVKAGDVDAQSIGYLPGADTPQQKAVLFDDQGRRHLWAVDLYEFGPLAFAMNASARILSAKAGLDPQGPFVQLVEQASMATCAVLLEAEAVAQRKDRLSKDNIEALEGHVEDARSSIAALETLIKGYAEPGGQAPGEDLTSSLKLQMEMARARLRQSGVKEVL